MSQTQDDLKDVVSGSGRHALFRLARIARSGGASAPDVADAIEKILGNDMRRIERAMDAARQLPLGTTAAAHSVVDDSGDVGK